MKNPDPQAAPVPPFGSPAGWFAYFRDAPIPVLAETAATLHELAPQQDALDAHLLADIFSGDPLMTLRVLAHVGVHSRRSTDIETVTGALVMLGIGPFFRAFDALPTAESGLTGQPGALEGLRDVIQRAHRAANFALGFAVHRLDHDAAVIHAAALLHDFAEMLLWCHAPALALEIGQRQRADPTLRSAAVQRAVLGFELADLQQSLMKAWHLPELLIQLDDDRHAESAAVRNVLLAIQFARHTARGWDNAAVPDDVQAIGDLLRLAPAPTWRLLHDLDDA